MALVAYAPGKDFPAVSVTGKSCALDCAHCSGRYLAGMEPATSPEVLWAFASGLAARGGTGLLLSGGCDAAGHVPLEPFIELIPRICRELGLRVNVHVGVSGEDFLDALASAIPDAVSVDVVGDDDVVKDVFGLGSGAEAYWSTYEGLLARGLNAVPHLTVGLKGGKDSGEEAAIKRLATLKPKRLVINFLVPTKGTRYEAAAFDRAKALEIVRLAREKLPAAFIVLGCMRPRGSGDFEAEAVGLGVDGVVNPPRKAVAGWESSGKVVVWRRTCCALD